MKTIDTLDIQEDLAAFSVTFVDTTYDTIEAMWNTFKEVIIENRVSSNITMSRQTHPWINRSIRRAIRRTEKAGKRVGRSDK